MLQSNFSLLLCVYIETMLYACVLICVVCTTSINVHKVCVFSVIRALTDK